MELKRTTNVSFDTNGSVNTVETQKVEKGKKAVKPTDPIKEGFNFDKWHLDNIEYTFLESVTNDIKLVASWEKEIDNEIECSIAINNDNGEAIYFEKVIEGKRMSEPTKPIKDGYVFKGWMINGVVVSFPLLITENITLIAKWEIIKDIPSTDLFKLVGFGKDAVGGNIVGAKKISVTTGAQILAALEEKKNEAKKGNDYGLIIMIGGIINETNTGAVEILIKDLNNISIIGVGSSAEVDGIGIRAVRVNQIVVQNLKIHHVLASKGEGDALSFESSKYIWVDHCEFYAEPVGSDAPNASASVKDKYDGLLDAKKESDFITYSWNYFHDSYKTSLNGFSDSDTYKRQITYHHNIFENINSRAPLFRNGYGHIYNNYYYNVWTSAINSRMGAEVLVENNIFENVKNPIVSLDSSQVGYWNLSGNIFENATSGEGSGINWTVDQESTCSFRPTYDYILDETTNLKALLRENTGVGVYSIEEEVTPEPGVDKYSVTYIFGNGNSNQVVNVDKNHLIGQPIDPIRNGYKFIGWYINDVLQTFPIEITSNTIFTAKWEFIPVEEGNKNEHNFTTDALVSNYFTFAGSTSKDRGTFQYGDILLTLSLKMDSKGLITFNVGIDNAKLILIAGSRTAGGTLKINGITFATDLLDAVVIEYELGLAGEYVIAKGDKELFIFYIAVILDKDVEVNPNEVKVTYNANNGTQLTVLTTEKGTLLAEPTEPQRPGSTFLGWYLDISNNTKWDFLVDEINANITLHAKWQDNAEVGEKPIPLPDPGIQVGDIYVSVNGIGDGISIANPTNLKDAILNITPGNTIHMLAGTYEFNDEIVIPLGNDGLENLYKSIRAYDNQLVILDFRSQPYNTSDLSVNFRGIELEANYWYIYGLTITGSADNGMMISGNYNIIENCVFDKNRDTGLQISRRVSSLANIADWPSYNWVFNSTSKNNFDPATGENADGFAAKLTSGEGNLFDGCIAHNNVDDGWDLYAKSATGPIGRVIIRNCIAYRNGQTETGQMTANSDGNGFKLGGSGIGTPHLIENSLAFENKAHGITDNNNPTAVKVVNCTSFNNSRISNGSKANFQMDRAVGGIYKNILSVTTIGTTASDKFVGVISSSIYFNTSKYYYVAEELSINKDKIGVIINNPGTAAFQDVTSPLMNFDCHLNWRNVDGTINTKGFLKPIGEYALLGANLS